MLLDILQTVSELAYCVDGSATSNLHLCISGAQVFRLVAASQSIGNMLERIHADVIWKSGSITLNKLCSFLLLSWDIRIIICTLKKEVSGSPQLLSTAVLGLKPI